MTEEDASADHATVPTLMHMAYARFHSEGKSWAAAPSTLRGPENAGETQETQVGAPNTPPSPAAETQVGPPDRPPSQAAEESRDNHEEHGLDVPCRRLKGKQNVADTQKRASTTTPRTVKRSHALSWSSYIGGNVVSQHACRLIKNFVSVSMAEACPKDPEGEDGNASSSDAELFKNHAGDLDLVHDTLKAIAAYDEQRQAPASERHAHTMQLGCDLWASAPLTEEERKDATEPNFNEGGFPTPQDAFVAALAAHTESKKQPEPFRGATEPSTLLYFNACEANMWAWLQLLSEENTPSFSRTNTYIGMRHPAHLERAGR